MQVEENIDRLSEINPGRKQDDYFLRPRGCGKILDGVAFDASAPARRFRQPSRVGFVAPAENRSATQHRAAARVRRGRVLLPVRFLTIASRSRLQALHYVLVSGGTLWAQSRPSI